MSRSSGTCVPYTTCTSSWTLHFHAANHSFVNAERRLAVLPFIYPCSTLTPQLLHILNNNLPTAARSAFPYVTSGRFSCMHKSFAATLTHSVNYKISIRVEGVFITWGLSAVYQLLFSLCWAEKALRIGVSCLVFKAKGFVIHPTVCRQWIWESGMVKWSNERWKIRALGMADWG
jgi:hypothetical protein